MNRLRVFSMMAGILVLATMGYGFGTEEIGPDSATGRATIAQPGWPKGIEAVPRHGSRVYSSWVNGNEEFYFQASPAGISELLDLFSKARLRDHEVRIVAEKASAKSFQGQAIEYNVALEIIGGIALHGIREENNSDTLEPKLTVYVGDDSAFLKQLKLPENLLVTGAVESPDLAGRKTKPVRTAWYGSVAFEDANPAAGQGLSSQVTLWEKGAEDGIPMGNVDYKGYFKVVLSDEEFAVLQKGDAWLTVTVGNYLAEAKRDGTKIPAAMLAREKEKALPLKVERPKPYYGRILFDDGSPAILGPKPWPNAEIMVDFGYVGSVEIDAEGYFQAVLEPAQIESLKAQKARKNIYRPRAEPAGESVATDVFPVELLSQDKEKAGVVKIPKGAAEGSFRKTEAGAAVEGIGIVRPVSGATTASLPGGGK